MTALRAVLAAFFCLIAAPVLAADDCPSGSATASYDHALNTGTCATLGEVDCGNGRFCPPGETCVPGGCTGGMRTGPVCGPYGHRCPAAELCNTPLGTCYNPSESYLC